MYMFSIGSKTNKWALEQIKPATSPEAEMTKQKLSYIRDIMRRQSSLKKTIMVGKIESSKKRGTSDMRWIDSLKEAIGMRVSRS